MKKEKVDGGPKDMLQIAVNNKGITHYEKEWKVYICSSKSTFNVSKLKTLCSLNLNLFYLF